MDIAASIVAAFVVGGLASLFTALWYRKRTDAETARQISEAWERLIEPLEKRINLLECENKTLKAQLKEYQAENQQLRERIRCLEREQGNGKK